MKGILDKIRSWLFPRDDILKYEIEKIKERTKIYKQITQAVKDNNIDEAKQLASKLDNLR